MAKPFIPAVLFAGAVCVSVAGELPPETPLVTGKFATVKARDFEAAMQRIPEKNREAVRMSQERVSSIVDGLFIAKTLAQQARDSGIDKDPIVQERLRQVQEQLLADLYLQKVEKEAKAPPLEQRARELYNADPKRYLVAEQVYVQQILISFSQRTPELALARATEVAAEARAAKDFLAVAATTSDDPDKRRNQGDLGWFAPTSFEPGITEWLKTAKNKGAISDPIRTRHGYHIVKFVDRQPARQRSFDEVKKDILAEQTANYTKTVRENTINAVREDKSVVIHAANVEALKSEIDPALLTRIQQQGTK